MIRVKFDLRRAAQNYSSALAHMAKLTGLDRRKIGRAEAGVILKTMASRTRPAQASELVLAGRVRTLRGMGLTSGDVDRGGVRVTVNAGVKARGTYGRTWARPAGSQKWQLVLGDNFSPVRRHFKGSVYNAAVNAARAAKVAVKKGVKEAKESAGIARKGWIQIADRLGIDLAAVPGGGEISPAAIARARMARAKGGKDRNNGQAREESTAQAWFATLIYGVPYGRRLGLDRTLTVVIAGRVKYFATAVAKGFNGSLKDTTRLFPGWTLNL